MPWAKLDDTFYDHKKTRNVLKTEPAAGFLFVMAIAYCSRHDTDGVIDAEIVDDWVSKTPFRGRRRQEVLNAMFELDLFQRRDDETLEVVGYLDWQNSSEERQRRRELRRESGRKGGLAKAANLASATSGRQERVLSTRSSRTEPITTNELVVPLNRSTGERGTE